MDELGNDARALLEAFRAEEGPSTARREKIWHDLEQTRAADRSRRKIAAEPRGRTPTGPGLPALRLAVPIGALAIAAALVLVVSRLVLLEGQPSDRVSNERASEALHESDTPGASGVAARIDPPSQLRDDATRLPREVGEHGAQEPPPDEPSGQTPAASARAAQAKERDSELAVIQGARRALRDGRAERALELLVRHERRFPDGDLAEERIFLRAQALCAAGRLVEARDLATDFAAEHPGSSYTGKMQRVCVQRPGGL